MENYFSIMVEIDNNQGKVEYTVEKVTLNILQSYMCDMFRMFPDSVKNAFADQDNLFYFYENPDEDDIVQFILAEELDNIRYEHYFVYAEDENEALHTLKDYFIKKYLF